MEERFDVEDEFIRDREKDKIYFLGRYKMCDLLNEQDEKIKELEADVDLWKSKAEHMLKICKNQSAKDLKKIYDFAEENQQLKQEVKQLKSDCSMYKSANYLINDIGIDKAREIMFQSEKKLKQSQNSKAIEVLEKVREIFIQSADEIGEEYREDYFSLTLGNIKRIINNQITELRGEENEKNTKQ